MPRSNMYLAYSNCLDMVKHIEIDEAKMLGFDVELVENCGNMLGSIEANIALVPRTIQHVSEDRVDSCLKNSKRILVGCVPSDTASARTLARIASTSTIVLTPKSLRFVDESQVNAMAQASTPRYLELHLYPFLIRMLEHPSINVEKMFYQLGKVVEKALKNDVAVIPSSSSPSIRKAILVSHIDSILYSMGFSRRERRLILELYPMDLLQRWLKD